jgi:hypothetical protein
MGMGRRAGGLKNTNAAAFVPCKKNKPGEAAYRYFSPALLGEGTDFLRYLSALSAGKVIYDPDTKVMNASTAKPSLKHRSQFRIPVKHLDALYHLFGPVEF